MKNQTHNLLPGRFSDLAAFGFRVFPAKPNSKEPALAWKKFQAEAPAAADIARWDASGLNVCVVTGAASGIVVLDVDSEEAQRVVDGLDLPKTPSVITARGRHLYFKAPWQRVKNSVKLAGVKLDVRGDGGYVVAPGSVHPDGSLYQWEVSPAEVAFASFPEQLLDLLGAKARPRSGAAVRVSTSRPGSFGAGIGRYIDNELREAIAELQKASEGARNDTLFKVSARMARHAAAAGVEWDAVANDLAASARTAGLDDAEVTRTLKSGWTAGSSLPTPWISTALEYVYLAHQDCFYHLESGKDMKREGFNGQHGHEYFGKGTFAAFLLKWGYIRKVFDLTYEPLNAQQYIERDGLVFLNTFRPSAVTAVAGDPAPFINFMTGLVPDEAEREHLLKMIAYTVCNPGKKLRYALLIRSTVQGVGKSMLGNIWSELIGLRNVRKTTPREIFSDFQGYLPEKLLVICEEMNLGMGSKAYNELKDILTSDTALVNEKYKQQREWPIYASVVLYSNLERPILIEPTDRRIYFIDSAATRREPEYYREFSAWWRANLGVIRGFLDSVDLAGFDPHEAPPMTAAKLGLIEGSKSELAQDLSWAIREREEGFDRDLVTLKGISFHLDRKCSPRKLGEALTEAGAVKLGQQRVGDVSRLSLWALRNVDYWRSASGGALKQELETQGGVFAFLDHTEVKVVHLASTSEAANLVRGFESFFEFKPPSV